MGRNYRKFDEDFKQGAVRLVIETGKPIAQVARDLGVNEGTLGDWCAKARQARDGGEAPLSESERTELNRLRKDNTELRMQRDVLKRSVALWVDEAMGRQRWPPSSPHRERADHQVPYATACRALGVSQPWFYKWRHGDASARHARREQLKVAIRRLFAAHRGTYGSPRITADLRDEGWRVSENTVAALMRELGLQARRKRRRRQTTRQGRGRWRAPDLISRDFAATGLNRKWYGDGTEIPTDEGKLHLDSVLDMGSRRIVGFTLGEHHDADLATSALQMAVAVRGGKHAITGVIFHTDQGSEYTAGDFRAACERCGITQSMGRVGSALDNAVIESWHSTVEFELRDLEHFTTRAQALRRVPAWIGEDNHDRRHSALGMRSPVAHELALQAASHEREQAA